MERRRTFEWFVDRIGQSVRQVRINQATGEVIMLNLPDVEITGSNDCNNCYFDLQDFTRFADKNELFVFEKIELLFTTKF